MFRTAHVFSPFAIAASICLAVTSVRPAAASQFPQPGVAAERSGSYSILYAFGGPPGDGSEPQAGVIVDRAGRIFGTTYFGGNVAEGSHGPYAGTLFELAPSGSSYAETFVYNMSCATVGCFPNGLPFEDRRGNVFVTNSSSAIGQGDG